MNIQATVKTTKKITRKDLPEKKQEKIIKDKVKEAPLHVPFNGQMFQISWKTIKKVKYYSMKEVEAAWHSSGGTGGRLDHWKAKEDVQELIKLTEIRVASFNGSGTWGDENAINLYASHCDIRFHLALSKAFNAIARGDYDEAKELTAYRNQRDDSKFYYHELGDAVKECIVIPMFGEVNADTPKREKVDYYQKTGKYYFREHQMINKIAGIGSGVRDYVDEEILKKIIFLQKANATFVYDGMPFIKRKEKLEVMFKKKFKLH